MSGPDHKRLLKVAASISDRAADGSGFVSLVALAREVQADLQFRPLLVEGIAAQPRSADGRWLVLIDSETHPVSGEMLSGESATRPLGSRLRNTVAHELAHALGPRIQEATIGSGRTRNEIVSDLERETEDVSPALLIPQRAIDLLLNSKKAPLSIAELVHARDRWSVSSRVFVNRFELTLQEDVPHLRHHPRLDGLVIGSGEWLGVDRVELHAMPFKGTEGLVPEFVLALRNRKKVSIAEFFPSPDFYLNGGSSSIMTADIWVGTSQRPRSETSEIEIEVEAVSRRAREPFLWIARTRRDLTSG